MFLAVKVGVNPDNIILEQPMSSFPAVLSGLDKSEQDYSCSVSDRFLHSNDDFYS